MMWLRKLLNEAGLGHYSLSKVLTVGLFAVALLALTVVKLTDIPSLGLAAIALSMAAVDEALKGMAAQRAKALSQALPQVAEAIASSVASGQELMSALRELSDVGPRRLKAVFRELGRLDDGGYPADQIFEWLRLELSNVYADQLIELLLVTHRSGGVGLVANLERLAATIRLDFATEGELLAKQGWVIGTAKLGVLSPWVILLFLNQRPEAHLYYSSRAGSILLVVGLAACLIAYAAIHMMSKLPNQRRVHHGTL